MMNLHCTAVSVSVSTLLRGSNFYGYFRSDRSVIVASSLAIAAELLPPRLFPRFSEFPSEPSLDWNFYAFGSIQIPAQFHDLISFCEFQYRQSMCREALQVHQTNGLGVLEHSKMSHRRFICHRFGCQTNLENPQCMADSADRCVSASGSAATSARPLGHVVPSSGLSLHSLAHGAAGGFR